MHPSLYLSQILLSYVLGAAAVPALQSRGCGGREYPGPVNPGFESGTLDGWTIVSGDAFGSSSVTNTSSFWGGPFSQDGKFFLWGYAQNGDTAVGQLKSSSFQASNVLSFLIGGGYDPDNVYVALVRDSDGHTLLKQTPQNDEALIRITWDTSAWAGQAVHLLVVDNSTAAFGHINFDDVRTGCAALGDNHLTFNVLGQANQPAAGSAEACSLYAADPLRPQFHYTPYQGWINDPSGLIQWNGKHHLFSQYNPAAPLWGPMHWSHAQSTDAVHWRELPVALQPPYPNNPQDTSGRYTGSAVRDSTGDLRLIFTDFTNTALHPGAVQEVVSTAASSQGTTFTLDSNNPVIAKPPANSESGFRDPKVFWDTIDNVWKLVIGSGDSVTGKVHLYRSTDLVDWTYVGVLFSGDGSTGNMWECPNFFPVGDKWVLFYGGRSLGWYHVGTYNGTVFVSESSGIVDAGPDSYAMQWYKDEAGRNLAITWMGNWDTDKWPSRINGWAGQQSITRELFIRSNGGLGSKPVSEVASLASGKAQNLGPKTIKSQATSLGSEQAARLQLQVDMKSTTASSFSLSLFSSAAESVLLTYFPGNHTLILDTTNAGYGQAGTWWAIIDGASETLDLDLFIDRSSLEIFAADGTVFTATVWPRYQESRGIELQANSGSAVFKGITLTPLGSSWC
ncbi:hypothetical protein HMPREF1624_06388 [Sporothrix schenckii ATCC 58251]|uniref:beta-fructofuranosidase n=1 Tax=Sporothrix schenckii (strain ATCC 58251 / de Perez 2211183) TaxID=1391915 RepID=U7PQP5_SPOS1|nr:hypothetical protein HMPREF1624_06388 [Sporothrix schenckii ATCC 58251]